MFNLQFWCLAFIVSRLSRCSYCTLGPIQSVISLPMLSENRSRGIQVSCSKPESIDGDPRHRLTSGAQRQIRLVALCLIRSLIVNLPIRRSQDGDANMTNPEQRRPFSGAMMSNIRGQVLLQDGSQIQLNETQLSSNSH